MKTVLFDLDGTLLNTAEDLTDSVNYILQKHGFSTVDKKTVIQHTGNATRNLLENCIHGTVEEKELNEILTEYKAYYADHFCIKTEPYPGVVDLLKRLQNTGYKVAIVSNKPMQVTKALCEKNFPGIYAIGEESGILRKPHPDMVKKAMDALHSTSKETVYVGDSEVDVMTAKNAGIPCISVAWGFRSVEEIMKAGATAVVNDCEELERKIMEALS